MPDLPPNPGLPTVALSQRERRRAFLRRTALGVGALPLGAQLVAPAAAWAQSTTTTIGPFPTTTTVFSSTLFTTTLGPFPTTTTVFTGTVFTTTVGPFPTTTVVATIIDPFTTPVTLTTLGGGTPPGGTAVPEPATLGLLAAGIAGMAALGARLRSRLTEADPPPGDPSADR